MRTLIFGLLAYIVLTGCGLLAGRLLKLRLTEGMIFAVGLIDLILYVTGLGGRFSVGIGILCGLGLAGFCLALAGDLTAAKSGRRNRRLTLMQEFLSPYYVMLTIIFLGSMVLYYGDFIWHIDEFHLYALSPKYMLETGKLPLAVDYIAGAKDVLAGSLFHLFFQKFTGYNEGMMYVSSTLLTWIGLLLPFAFTFGPAGWHFHRQGRERGEGAGGSVKAQGEGAGTAVKAGETGVRYRKGAWSGIILYTLILYIGIYSLYGYGIKNLYVDLPTLAWAAGLAGWWMASSDSFVSRFARVRSSRSRSSGNRAGEGGSPERKRGISFETSEILLVLLVLIMVTLFKPHIGLLLAVLAALFLLTEEIRRYLINRETQRRARAGRPRWKTVLLAFAALLVLAVLAVLAYAWNIGRTPEGMINFLGNAGASLWEKAKPVTIAFVTAIVGNSLSSNSELKLTLPTMSVLVLAIFMVGADLKNDRKRGLVYVIYSVAAEILYLGALFAAFLFIFSYEESIKVAGIGRYMTCIILFLLIIALVWLLAIPVRETAAGAEDVSAGAAAPGAEDVSAGAALGRSAPEGIARAAAAGRICGYVGLVLLVFFSLGLDRDYVPNHTSLNKPKAVGYEDIKRTREQAKEIKAVLKDGERVYILNQSNTNEFPTNGALYYLGDAVNNYLREPWKFTEIGNVTRLREGDEITIRDFPDILKSGGYNYVWVYTSNGYLKEALPEVMEVTWDVGKPEEETEAEAETKTAGEAAEGKEADAAAAAVSTDEPEPETEPVTEPVLANNRLYKVEVDDDGSVKLVGDRELWR